MRFLKLLPALLLAACAVSDGLPQTVRLPAEMPTAQWFKAEQADTEGRALHTTLLAVEPFGGEGCASAAPQYCLRFVQTDALGAPVARQIVSAAGRWRNDGFLPPKPEARRLFAAVAQQYGFAAYADVQENGAPDGQTTTLKHARLLWHSRRDNDRTVYTFPDQTRWIVSPIEE